MFNVSLLRFSNTTTSTSLSNENGKDQIEPVSIICCKSVLLNANAVHDCNAHVIDAFLVEYQNAAIVGKAGGVA